MSKNMYQKRKERQEEKSENNNEVLNKSVINWYPGHMAKTKRLIREMLDQIDIVYEVVDARIPYSSKIQNLEEVLQQKPRIMIMTKMDLCDRVETEKWIQYYKQYGYHILAMDIEHNFEKKPLLNLTEQLMEEKRQKRIAKGMKLGRTHVLVVGIPNVGKSTLINRLVGKNVAGTGNKPGVTKNLNWIRIHETIELLDSPGILWPKIDVGKVAYNLATLTAIKEEILPLFDVTEYLLRTLEEYYPSLLQERYGVLEVEEDVANTLEQIGKRRGCLIKGGTVDYEKVMNLLLNDVKSGQIRGITFDRMEQIYESK